MKKGCFFLVVMIITCSLFSSVNAETDLTGVWYMETYTGYGKTFTASDLGITETIDLRNGGIGYWNNSECAWHIDDNNLIIQDKDSTGSKNIFVIKQDKIITQYSYGTETETYTKNEPNMRRMPEISNQAVKEQFLGTWDVTDFLRKQTQTLRVLRSYYFSVIEVFYMTYKIDPDNITITTNINNNTFQQIYNYEYKDNKLEMTYGKSTSDVYLSVDGTLQTTLPIDDEDYRFTVLLQKTE